MRKSWLFLLLGLMMLPVSGWADTPPPAPLAQCPVGQDIARIAQEAVNSDWAADQFFQCSMFVRDTFERYMLGAGKTTKGNHGVPPLTNLFGGSAKISETMWASQGLSKPFDMNNLVPGDVIFQSYNNGGSGHVAIYIGMVNGVPMIAENSAYGTPKKIAPLMKFGEKPCPGYGSVLGACVTSVGSIDKFAAYVGGFSPKGASAGDCTMPTSSPYIPGLPPAPIGPGPVHEDHADPLLGALNAGYCDVDSDVNAVWIERLVDCFAAPNIQDERGRNRSGMVYKVAEDIMGMLEPFYLPLVGVLVLLAITLHGYKLVTGNMESVQKETLVLLLKLGAITLFLFKFVWFHEAVIGISYSMANIVGQSVGSMADICQNGSDTSTLWRQWDCVYNYLFGIGSNALMLGIIPFLFFFLFLPGLGTAIFFAGTYFVMTILLIGMRAVYIYLLAVVAMTFCVLLAPFFIPLILFGSTANYFKKYINLLLSYMLQPMLLFGVMAIFLVIMRFMIFTGPMSFYETFSGQPVTKAGFFAQRAVHGDIEKVTTGDTIGADGKGSIGSMATGAVSDTPDAYTLTPEERAICRGNGTSVTKCIPEMKAASTAAAPGTQDPNMQVGLLLNNYDVQKLASEQGSGNPLQYLINLLTSLIACCVMTFVMFTMLQSVPNISAALVDARINQASFAKTKTFGEDTVKGGVATARNAVRQRRDGHGRRESAGSSIRQRFNNAMHRRQDQQ